MRQKETVRVVNESSGSSLMMCRCVGVGDCCVVLHIRSCCAHGGLVGRAYP